MKFSRLLFIVFAILGFTFQAVSSPNSKAAPPGKGVLHKFDKTFKASVITNQKVSLPFSMGLYSDYVMLNPPLSASGYIVPHYKVRGPFRKGFYAQCEQLHFSL